MLFITLAEGAKVKSLEAAISYLTSTLGPENPQTRRKPKPLSSMRSPGSAIKEALAPTGPP